MLPKGHLSILVETYRKPETPLNEGWLLSGFGWGTAPRTVVMFCGRQPQLLGLSPARRVAAPGRASSRWGGSPGTAIAEALRAIT